MDASISAVIVDDEVRSRLSLKALLDRNFPEVSVVGMAASCQEARTLIRAQDPDLLFLDIDMPVETGFDLLASLPNHRFQVVFVTAFDQFAVRAFRANAMDYLLKPVVVEDLLDAITKVRSAIAAKLPERLQAAFQNLRNNLDSRKVDRLSLHDHQGTHIVETKEISYLEADTNYTHFHLCGGRRIVACHPLKDYEEILGPEGFFRVHRSFMINMAQLLAFSHAPTPEAKLKDGTRVEVSRRRIPQFQEEVRKWKVV